MKLKKPKKADIVTIIILILGIVARLIACILATPTEFQHDVTFESGHFDYAKYIYRNWHLADTNYYEFSQPPINAYLQAIVMKIASYFRSSHTGLIQLYSYSKYLTLIYSILTLIIIYKIIKEFDLPKYASNIFLAIMSFYPALIIMTTQYSNDSLGYMFFYLSLFLGIRWAKYKKASTIILLAISIGLGMLTKVSVGLIAFIIGPMMIAVLIKSIYHKDEMANVASTKNLTTKSIMIQLVIFALIVFPLGLSYSIRNYILFGQGFGEIFDIVKGSLFDTAIRPYSIFDRYVVFRFDRLFDKKYGIFHDWLEFNIWVDLIKTSTFDEFQFTFKNLYPILYTIYILNIIFWFVSFISIVYNIVCVAKKFLYKLSAAKKDKAKKGDSKCIENVVSYDNLRYLSLMLYFLAIVAYLLFNIRYPRSCNSNYRYIAYITFAQAGSLVVMLVELNRKNGKEEL